jgi:tetratricopeptide (TPR) repeat protein
MSALAVAFLVVSALPASAQSLPELRKLYDAGHYQQVIAAPASADPRVTYLVAQSHQKLGHRDEAQQVYGQLAGRGDADPWHDVGRSAVALLASDAGGAVDAANQAVARGDSLAEAHFQRGLALSVKQDMANAAAAFEKATQLDPSWADAHYYAGLAYSKAKRLDMTASHSTPSSRLAPQSPSRPEYSRLKTLAGNEAMTRGQGPGPVGVTYSIY